MNRSSRWPRRLLALAIVPTCWLGMMAVHELGHVLAAWLVGAKVERVVLHPFAFSRTDVAVNDSPRFIIWMGPIVGCVMPLMLWGLAALRRMSCAFVFKFFAGFCLIANGIYIGYGWLEEGGDASDLHALGESGLMMTIAGTITAVIGLALWSHVREEFGFGKETREVSVRLVIGTAALFVALLIVGFLLSN